MTEKERVLQNPPSKKYIWDPSCPFKLSDSEIDYAEGAFFEKESGKLCGYFNPPEQGGTVIIPKEVKIIPSCFKFQTKGLKRLIFKGDIADEFLSFKFTSCDLEEVVFESSFKRWYLKSDLFWGCKNLRAVTMPKGISRIPQNMFRNCTRLTHVEIPQGVEVIGANAFDDCAALTEVLIPDGVKVLEASAFAGCTSLKSISLPASLRHIYGKVFNGCHALQTVVFRGSKKQWAAVKKGHEETMGNSFQDFSRVGYDYAYCSTYQIPFELPNSSCQLVFEP